MSLITDLNLITVSYADDRMEYAYNVREIISEWKDKSPIIVVDLPEGYENRVLPAVKRLPAVSLLIDPLKRGIPIHPCNPAIEAVRCFLEWGLDLYFIDTCFPCSGSGDIWDRFSSCVARYGFTYVLEHAEEFEIDIPELIGLNKPECVPDYSPLFYDDPDLLPIADQVRMNDTHSEYFVSRQRYMAARLRDIVSKAQVPVIFVCHSMHLSSVMTMLYEDTSAPPMQVYIPVTDCRVRERNIPLITHEIPYCIYLYELFRDTRPQRKDWIQHICTEALKEDNPGSIETMIQFAEHLALAEGMRYPDIRALAQASASCTTPEYTKRFLDLAFMYPPADKNPNCEIIPVMDMNHGLFRDEHYLDWVYSYTTIRRKRREKNDHNTPSCSSTFTRTTQSLSSERKWMQYMQHRFRYQVPGDTHHPAPYVSGIADGIDLSETLKHFYSDELYVREPDLKNQATYVLYFGGDPTWQIYWDRQNLMAGTAEREGNRFTVTSLVAFLYPVPIKKIYQNIHTWTPLESSISVALSYGRNIFLFSDEKPDLTRFGKNQQRIQWIPLQRIPHAVLEKIRVFYVT